MVRAGDRYGFLSVIDGALSEKLPGQRECHRGPAYGGTGKDEEISRGTGAGKNAGVSGGTRTGKVTEITKEPGIGKNAGIRKKGGV